MSNLKSLSIFIGTAQCNARCKHCAGVPLRKHAPKEDGVIDESLIYNTIKDCYNQGARYLSISSSGEPTLSPLAVTKVLKLVNGCENEGIKYSPINLYSNGIKIGEDKSFCNQYLNQWQNYGLTTLYVTVHNIDEKKNAEIYGIEKYPSLKQVISNIHDVGLLMRANLVLSKKTIGTFEEFSYTIEHLIDMGVDYVSAWPIREVHSDRIDSKMSPLEEELDKMGGWIKKNEHFCSKVRLLGKNNHEVYQTGQKLTLFPNGLLSSTWCNY